MRSNPQRRVEVIDSRKACGALAMAAYAGVAAARAGGDVDAVAARVREASETIRLWFAVDTLEFLQRGGRIGAAQAWMGGALKIKPILTVEGEITPIERVRTSGRAFERMVEFLRSSSRRRDGWMVQHIQAPSRPSDLVEAGREIFGNEPVLVSEIGPVIGAHVGPGLLGVGGAPASLLAGSSGVRVADWARQIAITPGPAPPRRLSRPHRRRRPFRAALVVAGRSGSTHWRRVAPAGTPACHSHSS